MTALAFAFPTTDRQADLNTRFLNLAACLPKGESFDSNTWNLAAWSKRPRKTLNLRFSEIGNPDLIGLCKVHILEKRHMQGSGPGTADMTFRAYCALGHVMQARSSDTLTRGDFVQTEKWLIKTYGPGTAYRISSELSRVALWLRDVLEKPLSHTPNGHMPRTHGRGSTHISAHEKLLPTEVLSDFLMARTRPDLSLRDRFFLHTLALQVACGFRAFEMASLPVDCLIEDEGQLLVRNFSTKGGRAAPRPISPHLIPMVKACVATLTEMTEGGRRAAHRIEDTVLWDWSRIAHDADALDHFVAIEAHKWTRDPDRRIINPDGVLIQKTGQIVDILALKDKLGSALAVSKHLGIDRGTVTFLLAEQTASRAGKLSAQAQKRTSWDTDPRVFSLKALSEAIGTTALVKSPHLTRIQEHIRSVQTTQLQGSVIPEPPPNPDLEMAFRKAPPVVLTDGQGNALLKTKDALLVLEGNALAHLKSTRTDDVHVVATADLNRWLSGEKRGRGTGGPEDAAGARLDIRDPRTGDFATFTWHDVRHWLNTTYEAGGLTQEQIAMLFNRRNTKHNSVYSHIPHQDRTEGVRALMATGAVSGPLANAVNTIAEHSREDAERYLQVMTQTHTPMPHGLCTLNWALETCPHHMSCFSCNRDPQTGKGQACEHLVVDTENPEQMAEIQRVHNTSAALITLLEERELDDSPALAHHQSIVDATHTLLIGKAPTS